MQTPEPQPAKSDAVISRFDDDEDMSVYDDIPAQTASAGDAPKRPLSTRESALPDDAQDNYFEKRDPAEVAFCFILAAAYAGLAKFCWQPLSTTHQWDYFFSVEGFFITIALLAIVLGLRPYLSPSSLQISNHGIKYRGPYWPQRKTVNWHQIFQLYLSSDLVVVLYHPPNKPNGFRFLFIQCNYLSDRNQIISRFAKYAQVQPVYLRNPDWYVKAIFLLGYLAVVCWIIYTLSVASH